MAYVISSDCINCSTCVDGCPVSAISQGDTQHVIDKEVCIDCGACAEVCPVSCISPEA